MTDHPRGAVDLGDLHPGDDHAGHDLAREAHDLVLGGVHVERLHPGHGADHADVLEPLDAGGAEGPVVAAGADHHLGLHHVGVHARLRVVVHGHERPVGDHAADAPPPHDQVLHRHGVEQLHVGPRQEPAHHGGREQRRVLDHHVVLGLVVAHAQLVQEQVRRPAHHHGREQLPAQPRAAARGHGLLHDGHAHGGVLGQLVRAGQARGPGAHDHHVGVGVGDHVRHVAPGHLAGHDGLLDGAEPEGRQVVGRGGGGGDGRADGAAAGARGGHGHGRRGGGARGRREPGAREGGLEEAGRGGGGHC
uniref:Uncharacterized protein n=1 Tax=Zea mays TaxID=4577 RepID=A0A804NGZ8_MAIZE